MAEHEDSANGYDEALRSLRNSIFLGSGGRRLNSVLITSASPSEGKSTVAAHLAAAHADQNQRTLLIDGDLRRPSAHRLLSMSSETGLSVVLSTGMPWREAVRASPGVPGLDVLCAGPANRRAADLVGRSLLQVLREAEQDYDFVVLDSPPLIGFPEPLQMAAAVDGVVIVTRAGHTNRQAVATVLSTLRRVQATVIGLVLNEVTKEMSGSYQYYGYYGKYYQPDDAPKVRSAAA